MSIDSASCGPASPKPLGRIEVGGSCPIDSLIDISVDLPFQTELKETWLRAAMEAALDVASTGGEASQVSLLVTVDETVQQLNRDYRGLDEVTDVLSFSVSHSGEWEGEVPPSPEFHEFFGPDNSGHDSLSNEGQPSFVYPPDEPAPLGEVVIAYPQAQRQALARGVPLDRELALLIVHGVLHLAGHDHLEPREEAIMQAKEQAALQSIPDAVIPQAANS